MKDLVSKIFKGDKAIWFIYLVLVVFSVLEVFSSTSTLVYNTGNHWGPITKHVIFIFIGFCLLSVVKLMPYKRYLEINKFLLLGTPVLLLFTLAFMGKVNNAARTVSIGAFGFQPSELAKLTLIIAVANFLSIRGEDGKPVPGTFFKIMLVTIPICALIVSENLSTALLIGLVVLVMMFIGGISKRTLFKFVGTMSILGVLFAIGIHYAIQAGVEIPMGHRFKTWDSRIMTRIQRSPSEKFDINKSAQEGHAYIAIATSNIIGKGPGNSVQRDFLSQAYSDFIFAIVIEEFGIEGAFILLFLYMMLLIKAGRIAQKCKADFPALLVMGLAIMIVTQALFNMGVAVGILPVTGQPLPLISRGGTSILLYSIFIGMMLGVDISATDKADEEPAEDSNEENAEALPAGVVRIDETKEEIPGDPELAKKVDEVFE